jgi:hypothetical protein
VYRQPEAEELLDLIRLVWREQGGSPKLVADWLRASGAQPRTLAAQAEAGLKARGVHLGCPVCEHTQRAAIDAALKHSSKFKIAREFGVSLAAVRPHRSHRHP